MADERDNITDGGTAGTGEAEALPERDTAPPQQGQGDDLADTLGGGEGSGAGATGAGSATGDSADVRSEGGGAGTGLGGIDAGSPGGMGGVHARGGTGTGRPPGGVSPLGSSSDE
jgi:hypothetical protein